MQSLVNKAESLEQLSKIFEEVEDDFILLGNEPNMEMNKVIVKPIEGGGSNSHHREETDSLTDRR